MKDCNGSTIKRVNEDRLVCMLIFVCWLCIASIGMLAYIGITDCIDSLVLIGIWGDIGIFVCLVLLGLISMWGIRGMMVCLDSLDCITMWGIRGDIGILEF